MSECKCNFAQRMQGSGCDVCNPVEAWLMAHAEGLHDMDTGVECYSVDKAPLHKLLADNAALRQQAEAMAEALGAILKLAADEPFHHIRHGCERVAPNARAALSAYRVQGEGEGV